MAEMYSEDAVFDVSAVFADVRPMHGRAEMRRYWTELRDVWAGIRQEPVEVVDLGAGRFAVEIRLHGTGSQSGAEVDQRFAMLYTVRTSDEKVLSARLYPDLASAIAASAGGAA